jgi:ATP/maltotriose-dependent transcriptional regulator MalT
MQREVGNKSGTAFSLLHLARLLFVSQSDPTTARTLLEEGLTLFEEVGDRPGMAESAYFLGQFAFNQGDTARARSQTEESVRLFKELGDRQGTANTLFFLGRIVAAQGDYAAARALYEESFVLGREMDDKALIASYLEGLAGLIVAQGEAVWAARLWGAAEALRKAMDISLPPEYRADYERAVASARHLLGEGVFAMAWAEGHAMTTEQALAARETAVIPKEMPPVTPSITPVTPAPSYLAGLTTREVEVLRLVAQGLSNAQIAEQLIISPYTVNAHMRSIYNKLEVTSRIAVMQYAIRHHLI